MIKAVIFDLYGVLALNGWQAFKAKHFTDRPEVWDQVFEIGRKVDAGLADYDELVRFTSEQSGEIEDMVRYQLEHTVANEPLLDYICTDLKSKYKLAILSNTSRPEVIPEVFSQNEQDLFDEIILSRHHGAIKPDPEIFELAAAKIGVQTEECLFVDDLERHANGAKQAGMQALVYTDVAELKREVAKLL